jgi:hypothetical protein
MTRNLDRRKELVMKGIIAATLLGLSATAMSTSASAQEFFYVEPDGARAYSYHDDEVHNPRGQTRGHIWYDIEENLP